MNRLTLCLLIAFSTLHAYAAEPFPDAQPVNIQPRPSGPIHIIQFQKVKPVFSPNSRAKSRNQYLPAAFPSALNSQMYQSADDLATVIAAWNPATDKETIRKVLLRRIGIDGMENGLLNPTLMMIDVSMLQNHREIASLLLPSVSRLSPETGSRISGLLGVRAIDLDSFEGESAITGLRNKMTDSLNRKYGLDDGLNPQGLRRGLADLDPSGIAGAIFGPNSAIYRELNDADSPTSRDIGQHSPIYGMSRDEVKACFSRCVSFAGTTSAKSKEIYGTAGATIGLAIGKPGAGLLAGEIAGAISGFAGGALVCAARHCGGDDPAAANNPQPSTPSHEPSAPLTKNNPGTPAPEPSTPEPSAPEPSTPDPKTDNDGGGSHPDHCSDDNCTMNAYVNPDRDMDGGPSAPSDTGLPRVGRDRSQRSAIETWNRSLRAPVVNPVRSDWNGRRRGRS
jgi:hypothetical protein